MTGLISVLGANHDATTGICQGLAAYSRQHTSWRIEVVTSENAEELEWLIQCGCLGAVGVSRPAAALPRIIRSGLPFVNTLEDVVGVSVPCVVPDDAAIGAAAVEHLSDAGFRRISFYGVNAPWALNRYRGARRAARRQQRAWSSNAITESDEQFPEWLDALSQDAVRRFAMRLTKPAAVVAFSDLAGRLIADQCVDLRVKVPDELAVIGVDNAKSICESGAIELSSVDPDLKRIGFEAGRKLDTLIRGRDVERVTCVPPGGVVRRRSTDPSVQEDPLVAAAIRYIQEQAFEGGTVESLCAHLDVSRRHIEKRFAAATGRTPGEHFLHLRLIRARELLTATNLSITQIALRCGYGQVSSFSAAFHREIGMSPRDYRQRHSAA